MAGRYKTNEGGVSDQEMSAAQALADEMVTELVTGTVFNTGDPKNPVKRRVMLSPRRQGDRVVVTIYTDGNKEGCEVSILALAVLKLRGRYQIVY